MAWDGDENSSPETAKEESSEIVKEESPEIVKKESLKEKQSDCFADGGIATILLLLNSLSGEQTTLPRASTAASIAMFEKIIQLAPCLKYNQNEDPFYMQ